MKERLITKFVFQIVLFSKMQKDPVDYILEKIVCELLKQEEISTISQTSLTSIVDLIRNCTLNNLLFYE